MSDLIREKWGLYFVLAEGRTHEDALKLAEDRDGPFKSSVEVEKVKRAGKDYYRVRVLAR